MPSSTFDPVEVRQALTQFALDQGFDDVGFMAPSALAGKGDELEAYVDAGHHGDMAWMKDRLFHRQAPENLWPEVKSIMALAMNYGPAMDPRSYLEWRDRANISVYARGKDYHDIVKKKLKAIGRFMAQTYGCALKVFVDTAPVMEKPIGAAAGLGWQGKHTNMVSPRFGNWVFLGAIFMDMDLGEGPGHRDQCGSCHACLDACPTGAFPAPYRIDARRCISYLTIEYKGPIPEEFRKAMGNRIYGCDDCLAACPWNKFAKTAQESAYFARVELGAPRLGDLLKLDDATFRQVFSGSPIKRIGRDRFIRNCLIAAGNSDDQTLFAICNSLCSDPDPVVREAAEWACDQLKQ